MEHVSERLVTSIVADAAAAGQTDINGSILDMHGFDGVRLLLAIVGNAATGVLTLAVQQGDASDLSDATTSTQVATATGGANALAGNLLILDAAKFTKRYVRGHVTRTVANSTTGVMIAEQYLSRDIPTTQDGDVAQLTKVNNPTFA